MPTQVENLASFVDNASKKELTPKILSALKIRILDSLGCALGALKGEPIVFLRTHLDDFGGTPHCTLIGGGKSAPDRAAFYNGALIRYLDFNDSFLAKKETCHPSDNLSSILAACEYADGTGEDLLLGLAIAYQVQCRLSEVAPVRDKGFDHTVQGAYAAAAGVSKALHLNHFQTANAIAISATAHNALRVTRTGALSHWKGLAYPETAFCAVHSTFLAMRGITGPLEIFEGNKGFMHAISGPFSIDWKKESLDAVTRTIVKKFNAEIHSQSTLEGILDFRRTQNPRVEEIEKIDIEIFDVAFHIIGGGEEGNKTIVRTKEEADHSLPYMIAAALLDGDVTPKQYLPERIQKNDIQTLLKKITIQPNSDFSKRFPQEMPVRIRITKKDGTLFTIEKNDYEGFVTKPMSWDSALTKFYQLGIPMIDQNKLKKISEAILDLENIKIRNFTPLLGDINTKEDL